MIPIWPESQARSRQRRQARGIHWRPRLNSDPQSGVADDSFHPERRYIAINLNVPMTELVLLSGVLGLLALIWMGLDSDDDNGGGGLMQPSLVPVPVRRSR